MEIYGFRPHPEVIHNAAPVMPQPPVSALGAAAPPFKTLQGLRLSGQLNRDTFTRKHPIDAGSQPVSYTPLPHQEALRQLTGLTPAAARAHIAQDMAKGDMPELTRVAGWFSAAQTEGKILFASREGAAENFKQHLGKAVVAIKEGDWTAARLYLQRARREMFDFTGLRSTAPVNPDFPPRQNPFILQY